jgi:hypothetical protein
MSARLSMPSWNLFDVFDIGSLETARLTPRVRTFSNFNDAFQVRAGSSAYFRVGGASRPAAAIRVRNRSGDPLPTTMQVFVVRLR